MRRQLLRFRQLVIVNLVETTPEREEKKLTDAFLRNLIMLNSSDLTYIGFDFHEYW